jgi:hypothetical protein
MTRTTRALIVTSLLVGLAPRTSLAQSTAAAEALFNEGRSAMDAKDYDTACQRFRESNRLDPAVGTLLNLAVCETTRGHVATAWELFRSVAEKLPPNDPRGDYVTSQLTQIEPRLPKLTLRLAAGAPADTRATEGQAEFAGAAFGIPLPMDPGKHTFVVEAKDHEPRTFDVELAEAAKQDLEIAPGAEKPKAVAPAAPAAATEPVPADTAPSHGHDTRVLGWALGGVGVAGLGVGAVFGAMALGKKHVTDEQCNDTTKVCSQEGKDAASTGATFATVSTVGWVVGVLGVGAGTYFLLTSDSKSGSETALATDVYAGGGGLRLRRTF